jgi:valyl-tRNA synthetase
MKKELAKTYDPKGIEDRLYKKWMENGYFHAEVNPDKKPFTIVMPPPNITGQLHMGHALDNTMQDILIRWKGWKDMRHCGSRERIMPPSRRKSR